MVHGHPHRRFAEHRPNSGDRRALRGAGSSARFEGHTKQRAWALRNLPFAHEWVLRSGCGPSRDRRTAGGTYGPLCRAARRASTGYFICRRQIFRGRWIRFGGYYPKYQLKLFRHDRAFLDDNEFDYRFYVTGRTDKLKHDIVESNQNEWGISFFVEKHNKFASELATEEMKRVERQTGVPGQGGFFRQPDQRILWLKVKWNTLPLYLRPFLLFTLQILPAPGVSGRERRFHLSFPAESLVPPAGRYKTRGTGGGSRKASAAPAGAAR